MTNTNKPLILFDIDLTLIDSIRLRHTYNSQLSYELKISIKEFNDTKDKYLNRLEKSTDFLPEDFLKHIADTHNHSYQTLQNIYYNPENFQDALYPDTIPALQKLKKEYIFGIYSEGFFSFQITKLKYSGIYNYFDPDFIYIHRRKAISDIPKTLPGGTIIVDDRIEALESLSQFPNLSLVWLNRKDNSIHPSIPTIQSLNELE